MKDFYEGFNSFFDKLASHLTSKLSNYQITEFKLWCVQFRINAENKVLDKTLIGIEKFIV